MRTYVALSLITSANALAAPTTTPPKAPLPFTSPKKVDEALRKNDPLLHLASRLIRDVNARRGVRSVYAWCRRADDVADEAGVDSAQALARLDEIEADLRAALQGAQATCGCARSIGLAARRGGHVIISRFLHGVGARARRRAARATTRSASGRVDAL